MPPAGKGGGCGHHPRPLPGIPGRPRFRSTTPGLVTRPTARPGGVRLVERVEGTGDGLISPTQAQVLHTLRRAVAIALAMGETFAEATGLVELKKANLEARLPDNRRAEFTELLAAEALVVLHVMANATAFLLAPHLGETTVEIGAVEEVLTDNAPSPCKGPCGNWIRTSPCMPPMRRGWSPPSRALPRR